MTIFLAILTIVFLILIFLVFFATFNENIIQQSSEEGLIIIRAICFALVAYFCLILPILL